ncbi:hypothetical protein NPIL_426861 [Nephila pilipes]|uniref:Uncharacterized protein n=1 Tax=Nephila pilipes TaxID=299642 RepID=A0A8X6R1C1_NEPPI|nr:hypothetical protein NPIL_426861 [Nephila pilipes]
MLGPPKTKITRQLCSPSISLTIDKPFVGTTRKRDLGRFRFTSKGQLNAANDKLVFSTKMLEVWKQTTMNIIIKIFIRSLLPLISPERSVLISGARRSRVLLSAYYKNMVANVERRYMIIDIFHTLLLNGPALRIHPSNQHCKVETRKPNTAGRSDISDIHAAVQVRNNRFPYSSLYPVPFARNKRHVTTTNTATDQLFSLLTESEITWFSSSWSGLNPGNYVFETMCSFTTKPLSWIKLIMRPPELTRKGKYHIDAIIRTKGKIGIYLLGGETG